MKRNMSYLWRGALGAAALVLLLGGCASSGSGAGASGGLMGLDDGPQEPVWAGWQVDPAASELLPSAFVDEVVAFDYWQIEDTAFRERAWTGAASLLDYLRRDAGEGGALKERQARTATLLLQAFEGRQGDNSEPSGQMDVTYVVSLDPAQEMEGVVVRFYAHIDSKDVTPALGIFLGRIADAGESFERAFLWTRPGFEEAEAFTMQLERAADEQAGWGARLERGQTWGAQDSEAPAPELGEVAELTATIFEQDFWGPLTGPDYVEAAPRADQEIELPGDIEPAIGLPVRERQIEEIYRDTVFVPRVDTPAQFL